MWCSWSLYEFPRKISMSGYEKYYVEISADSVFLEMNVFQVAKYIFKYWKFFSPWRSLKNETKFCQWNRIFFMNLFHCILKFLQITRNLLIQCFEYVTGRNASAIILAMSFVNWKIYKWCFFHILYYRTKLDVVFGEWVEVYNFYVTKISVMKSENIFLHIKKYIFCREHFPVFITYSHIACLLRKMNDFTFCWLMMNDICWKI